MDLSVSAVSAFDTAMKFLYRIVNRYTVTLGIVGFHAPTLSTAITVIIFFWALNNFYEKIVKEVFLKEVYCIHCYH